MTYSLRAVQDAVQAKLAADTAVQAMLGSPVRLYDHAPPQTAYPFVRYGDQRAEALDTKDLTGLSITFNLECYSRYRGRKELRQVEEAVYAALHNQTLTVANGIFCQCQFATAEQTLESDGLTYRSRLRFRITTFS